MTKTYFFKRAVGPGDWGALPRRFLAGEPVELFNGHTYDLDRDDMIYGGRETIPVCRPGDDGGFFTCPVEFLEDENGVPPAGAYRRGPR